MRWSYKTIHFGLKKDGLLGGAFVDDAEIEETLNEYGQGGWELVSMFETRDGVIAVFKQPLDLRLDRQPAAEAPKAVSQSFAPGAKKRVYEPELLEEPAEDETYPVLDEPEEVDDEDEGDDRDSPIGSIRIE